MLVKWKLRRQFWLNIYSYNCQRAFVLQKRSIRTIVRISRRESCRPHFLVQKMVAVPRLYVLVLLTNLKKHLHEYETYEEKLIRENSRRNYYIINRILNSLCCIVHAVLYLLTSTGRAGSSPSGRFPSQQDSIGRRQSPK